MTFCSLVMRADFIKSCCIELFPKDNSSALSSFALRRGELGDGLGSLRHGVLGQITGKHETDGGLDLAGRESGLLVVGGELPGFAGNALEDVVDERVHDAHPLLADAGVGVDLLEDRGPCRCRWSRIRHASCCASSCRPRREPSWRPWQEPAWMVFLPWWKWMRRDYYRNLAKPHQLVTMPPPPVRRHHQIAASGRDP